MHLCMLDYVGNDKVGPSLNVVEVCRQISEVKQMRMVDGKLHTATPDKLFDELSETSISLPDNASSWTLQLCSSYLSALTLDFSEAVTSEKNICDAICIHTHNKGTSIDCTAYRQIISIC